MKFLYFRLAKELRYRQGFQVDVLSPLSKLLESKYDDVQEHILLSVFDILQATGQSLREGWPKLLNILGTVVSIPFLGRLYFLSCFSLNMKLDLYISGLKAYNSFVTTF